MIANNGFYNGDLSAYGLRKYYPYGNENFRQRKLDRTNFNNALVYGNKLIQCCACSGSGYYCGGACGCCDGTGRERQR